ncbi:MAG: DNA polymerase III subunit epsilon [Betaproteobacteria bacterium]|nr:DNA polymerase III subunit epsilon [Betaproteobacteria bacterium]
MRQILLDTETTGLDPRQGHRIIEIACVEMQKRRFTSKDLHHYIHPERDIDPDATGVHGITLDMLEGKPRFADIADEFLRFVEGAELIIHNAPFDVGFINAELDRLGRPALATICSVTDTLAMARELHPGKKNSLDALCERYQIDRSARVLHGALLDARLLGEVYMAMTRGQDSLEIGMDADAADTGDSANIRKTRPTRLKLVRASTEELRLHAAQVESIDKASGGKAVWKSMSGAPQGKDA